MADYDKINIGDKAEIEHEITAADVARFVELTGDDNRLHIDADYASRTNLKTPVAHGMLGASFISTLIGTKLPGDGALWFSQNLDFLLPVRVGDRIKVIAEVLKKSDRDRVIELSTNIYNQNRQKVTAGTAKVKVIAQQQAAVPSVSATAPRKVALIIGASGGIGSEVCRKFAENGYDLVLHYNLNQKQAELVKTVAESCGVKATLVRANLQSEDQVENIVQAVARFTEKVDTIVNLATSKTPTQSLDILLWDDFLKHLNINIKSNLLLVKKFVPLMNGGSSFVFVTTQATDAPVSGWLPYITAKAALEGFARTLAVELASKKIRVNLVSPGMTETELIADIPQKTRLMVEAKAPRGRLAKPRDIANAIFYLADVQSDYVTGETLRINGGMVMV